MFAANEYFEIKIIFKSHECLVLDCLSEWRVRNLKWKIHEETKIEPNDQRLFFEGMLLDDDYTLSNYGIELQPQQFEKASLQSLEPINFEIYLLQPFKGIPQTYFLDEVHYDQKWNCSYENIYDRKVHYRGGHQYVRPVGCVRYGVKVSGKYENDDWLGGKGYRTETEWPVAYHGTKELNVLEILRHGFLLEKGVRFAFGKGIYCTPDPLVAMGYAHNYEFNGFLYKLIIQCRVDPKRLQIVHGNSWKGAYWLVPDGTAIRPYAICVFTDRMSATWSARQQATQNPNLMPSTSASASVAPTQQQQLPAALSNYIQYSKPYTQFKAFQQGIVQQQQQIQTVLQQQQTAPQIQQQTAPKIQQQTAPQIQQQTAPQIQQPLRQTAKKCIVPRQTTAKKCHMPMNPNASSQQINNVPGTSNKDSSSGIVYRMMLTQDGYATDNSSNSSDIIFLPTPDNATNAATANATIGNNARNAGDGANGHDGSETTAGK